MVVLFPIVAVLGGLAGIATGASAKLKMLRTAMRKTRFITTSAYTDGDFMGGVAKLYEV